MITLRNLFEVFGHDPKWATLATKYVRPMTEVFLCVWGDRDIKTITPFDVEMRLAEVKASSESKARAASCMGHLRTWGKEQGKAFGEAPKSEPKTQPKVNIRTRTKKSVIKEYEVKERELDWAGIPLHGWHTDGCVYKDEASAGQKNGKRVYKDRWIGEFYCGGVHFRHRSKYKTECEEWRRAVRMGRIKPWDNGPDWRKIEQKKYLDVRYGEQIVSAAEEACLLLNYHESGNLDAINDYIEGRLLPHMMYYAAHTLQMCKKKAIDAVVQCAGIILTDIVMGKPVTNFTRQAKRMLRIRKANRDFWYYENAPKDVMNFVNNIDLSGLEDVYKIIKNKKV